MNFEKFKFQDKKVFKRFEEEKVQKVGQDKDHELTAEKYFKLVLKFLQWLCPLRMTFP